MGDLALSRREDELSTQWPKCLDGDRRAFRVTTAFARLIARAGKAIRSGSGAAGRWPESRRDQPCRLVASDSVVIPLAPDLFSLQGLRNVGPTLREVAEGLERARRKETGSAGHRTAVGQHASAGLRHHAAFIRLSRPVQAYGRWIDKIPSEYAEAVTQDGLPSAPAEQDPNCLAHLKDYRSLMPMAQEANRPHVSAEAGPRRHRRASTGGP